jgi:hypothetical protein
MNNGLVHVFRKYPKNHAQGRFDLL